MYNFSQTAVKLIRDYKTVVKKQFSTKEVELKLAELQLNKRLPTKEAALYGLLEKIVQKSGEYEVTPQSRLRYCGTKQLVQHIKKVLDLYHMENRRVINSAQLASRAMIDAIQLMSLPKGKRTEEVASKLQSCSVAIAQNGSEEQKKIFVNSLQSYVDRDRDFFSPLLDYFRRSSSEYNFSVTEEVALS